MRDMVIKEMPEVDQDRFDRQKRIEQWDQQKVSAQNVLVIGAGALGNETVKLLLQLGIGKITLVDFDTVVPANLNRCLFFNTEDAEQHRFKAEVIRDRAAKAYPDTVITTATTQVESLPEDSFSKHGAVFGCLDNLGARLHANAQAYGKAPLFDGGTTGFFGKLQVVASPSACIECAMSDRDYKMLQRRYSCVGEVLDIMDPKAPAIPTTTSIIAAMQVNEWLKHCFNIPTLAGKYLHYNGLTQKAEIFGVPKRPGCPVHQNNV